MDAGLSPEMAKKEIMPVAQNMNPGHWPEKDLWSWNRTVNEKLTVEDEGYAMLIPLTDRETDLMQWIDALAVEQRRTREQQILWILEKAMDQEAA